MPTPLLLLLLLSSLSSPASSFLPPLPPQSRVAFSSLRAEGFGKPADKPSTAKKTPPSPAGGQDASPLSPPPPPSPKSSTIPPSYDERSSSSPGGPPPSTSPPPPSTASSRTDSQRQNDLLEARFNMRPRQPTNREAKEADDRKRELAKQMAAGGDGDIFSLIPSPVIKAVSTFLQFGTAASTLLFVLAGLGITIEAASTTKLIPALPPAIDDFFVLTVGPNFTPGLLVLLGFSVSLGVFSAAQLGSEGAVYKEDRK